jgi:predicted transcriptional regulator
MGKVNLNVQVSEEVGQALTAYAKRSQNDVATVAAKAIDYFLAEEEAERLIMLEREAEAAKGEWISSEAVLKWLASWNSDNPLPAPEPDIFRKPT